MSGLICGISAAGVIAFMALLRAVGRSRYEAVAAQFDVAELERKYGRSRRIDRAVGLLIGLPATIALAAGIAIGLDRFYEWYVSASGDASCTRTLPGAYWALPGSAMAFVVVTGTVVLAYKLIFRERFGEWTAYGVLVLKYDVPSVASWFCAIGVAIFTSTTALGLDCYVRATPTSLEVNRFWSFGERVYQYKSIRMIDEATHEMPSGSQVRQIIYYTITFDDGSTWSTQEGFWDPNPDRLSTDRKIVEYVSRQSGVAIQRDRK